MTLLFIGITIFVGFSCANITSLAVKAFSFKSILDILITILLVIVYLLTIWVIYIFIIDLFYIIISYFLSNILRAIKKTYKPYYKFTHFTISGFIGEKTKVKKLLPIILGSLAGFLVLVATVSYFTKGYTYRSLNDQPAFIETKEYEENLKEIHIEGAEVNVLIEVDENLDKTAIFYKYEFSNSFEITNSEKVLKIKKASNKSFDLLGLFNEPTPQIIIILPNDDYLKKLNIKLDNGYIRLKDISNTSLDLNLDIYKTEFYLLNVDLGNINLESYNANIKIKNTDQEIDYTKEFEYSDITSLNVTLRRGNIYMQGVKIWNEMSIDNGDAEIKLLDSKITNLKIQNLAGNMLLDTIEGNSLDLDTSSKANILDTIKFINAKLKGKRSTKIETSRMMISETLEIFGETSAIINFKHLKSNEIKINNQSSIINLLYVNLPNEIEDSDNGYAKYKKELYNSYSVLKTNMFVESSGETYISDVVLDELNVKQEGMAFQVSNANIKNMTVVANNVKNLSFEKVIGIFKVENATDEKVYYKLNAHFTLNSSPLYYYNNEDKSEVSIKIKYTGMSKIDTDLKYDLEK